MENMEQTVHNLFSAGIQEREILLGFHGTSWESIKHLITTGKLPPSTSKNMDARRHHPAGRLYFAPTKNALPDHRLVNTFPSTVKEAFNEASGYADDLGVLHGFIQELALDIGDRKLTAGCRLAAKGARFHRKIKNMKKFFTSRLELDGYEHLCNLGISDNQIWSAMQIAQIRKGIVLGIKHSVRDIFELADGDNNNGDLSIVCPDGLPVEYISGLEPKGQFEYDQLNSLQTV